ncbi:MAG TPA: Rv2578c family radical SAM protein, partial [Actinomycetes bacterium]|nr:Rv2578c family radical SAM protein [Actinomycetes bacterium]
FHEVQARSVLNEVPGGSRLPFRWTVNPYRGCSHACRYCLSGDTLVLMGYGRVKRLAEVRAGDQVYGTELRGGVRHYVRTEVVAHWRTVRHAFRIELADGTTLVSSGDHRLLSDTGWRCASGTGPDGAPWPRLTVENAVIGPGRRLGRAANIAGSPLPDDARQQVVAVQSLNTDLPMYDITTGTGDFIANGVVSHNCFARGSHSWLELDTGAGFDTEIVVKVNAADVLARELARPSWSRDQVALGTNTDPYQRAEGRYRLMPGIISALAAACTPFSVLTKGTLLRRDLPLLARAAEAVLVGIGVSIAVYDEALHKAVEPGTPSPRARLDLVRAIRAAGLDCGVMLAPVLPWLTDGCDQLDAALAELAAAGATSATVLPLHLRPGAREWYLAWLARDHPQLVGPYQRLYAGGAYVPQGYLDLLANRVQPLLARHGFDHASSVRKRTVADDRPADRPPAQLSLL